MSGPSGDGRRSSAASTNRVAAVSLPPPTPADPASRGPGSPDRRPHLVPGDRAWRPPQGRCGIGRQHGIDRGRIGIEIEQTRAIVDRPGQIRRIVDADVTGISRPSPRVGNVRQTVPVPAASRSDRKYRLVDILDAGDQVGSRKLNMSSAANGPATGTGTSLSGRHPAHSSSPSTVTNGVRGADCVPSCEGDQPDQCRPPPTAGANRHR